MCHCPHILSFPLFSYDAGQAQKVVKMRNMSSQSENSFYQPPPGPSPTDPYAHYQQSTNYPPISAQQVYGVVPQVWNQPVTPDARWKVGLLWMFGLIMVFAAGLISRIVMGLVGIFFFSYIAIASTVIVPLLLGGLIYFCYPKTSTIKELLRPLDIGLTIGQFFCIYLHIITFPDITGDLYGEAINPFIEAVASDPYSLAELSFTISIGSGILAVFLWIGLGVSGFARRQALTTKSSTTPPQF